MKAYLDKPELKESFLAEIRRHQEADQIAQGSYGSGEGKNWRGCAVGCSIRSLNKINGTDYETNRHALYESQLGLPEWLVRLEDTIFEGLTVEDSKQWPYQFADAIPVGADLEPVKWQFSVYLMESNLQRVEALDIDPALKEQVLAAISEVKRLNEDAASTGAWDESAARSAARSAAWSAWSARSAAESAAESAAWSAWSARSAAWSAWSAAESAESAEMRKHADKLLELMRLAKAD